MRHAAVVGRPADVWRDVYPGKSFVVFSLRHTVDHSVSPFTLTAPSHGQRPCGLKVMGEPFLSEKGCL